MDEARQNILTRIRNANRQVEQTGSVKIVRERLVQHTRGPLPTSHDHTVESFIKKLEQAAASSEQVKSLEDIVQAVLLYIESQNLDKTLVRTSTTLLEQLEWPENFNSEARIATEHDTLALVEANLAIAETGSVVMCSSETRPVSLNFLPEHYLCVVRKHAIVNTMEDVWKYLREEDSGFPRAINVITGPSRTADVEQIIQLGAHGPRRLHVLLLEQ